MWLNWGAVSVTIYKYTVTIGVSQIGHQWKVSFKAGEPFSVQAEAA